MISITGIIDKVASRKLSVTAVALLVSMVVTLRHRHRHRLVAGEVVDLLDSGDRRADGSGWFG